MRDRQDLRQRFPGIVSTQPAPQPGMVVQPPSTSRPEQELLNLDGVKPERLRGGALACACCSGSQGTPSLDPQPEARQVAQLSQTAPAVPKASSEQTPQTTHPSKPQMVQKDGGQSTAKSLPPSSRAETGRAVSLPSTSKVPMPTPAHTRDRYGSLPSKPMPSLKASAARSDFTSIPESPPEDGRVGFRNLAIPPSVHTPGNRSAHGSSPLGHDPPPFMRD